MTDTAIFTGTVTEAAWREESIVDAYWLTITTEAGAVVLRGTDRMNALPTVGQRIRIAGRLTPKGHYSVAPLGDQTDPATAMPVQVEVLPSEDYSDAPPPSMDEDGTFYGDRGRI